MKDRLTDEKWREILDNPQQAPARPFWTEAFVVEE